MATRNLGRRRRVAAAAGAFAVVSVGVTLLCATAHGQETAQDTAKPGMTYESLSRLPDFSGWWYPAEFAPDAPAAPATGTAGDRPAVLYAVLLLTQDAALKLLLTPQAAAVLAPYDDFLRLAAASSSTLPDPADFGFKPDYCSPPFFAGNNGGFHEDIELLFTPGRVTLTNESGLIRRIYLKRALPADAGASAAGTSVGHWEGRTLIVETAGIDPDNQFLGPNFFNPLRIGRNARIAERVSLEGPDTLQIAARIVAPDVLTKPLEFTSAYRRDRGHTFHEVTQCARHDRSMDPITGKQRFDLTPPPDLPPPPRLEEPSSTRD